MSARSFRRSRAQRLAREQRRLATAKRRVLIAGATLGATAALAANAEAATYTVNSTADNGSGTCGSTCTLRDAVNTANTNGVAGTQDTINFAPNVTGTITLTQGQISISDPGGLNIDGPGAGTLSVSGGGASGIFAMTASGGNPEVSISGLTLTDGSSTSPGGAIDDETAPLTLSGDTVTGNTSTSLGGGVFVNIQGSTSLSVSDSTISGNTGYGGGGVAGFGPITISNSEITGNHSTSSFGGPAYGGGIEALGGLTLTGSTVSGNTAVDQGGGIFTKYTTTISDSTISQNTAAGGGGMDIDVAGGRGPTPVSVANSTVSGNQAAKGAGVEVRGDQSNSPITIQASTISGNQGGSSSFGGGLLITGELYSPFDLVDSTISGNTATDGGGVSLSYGGSTTKVLGSGGSITFDNSTVDANTADTAGGGIYLGAYSAGSPATNQSATADINSTIVANNTGSGTGNDLYRPTNSTSGGFNDTFSLIQNPGNAPLLSSQALITGVDPQLGPLANNGGPTETMLPKDTSPVIDQGKAKSGLSTDQRGDPRTVDNGKPKPPGGDGTDIGAVELAKIPATPPPPPPPPPPSISDTVGPASGITMTRATLHGTINTSGEAVTWHFEYGQSTAYGKVTPGQSISTGQGDVPVSFQVSGLKPGTRYHYRVVAVSAAGQTAVSTDATFKTPAPTLKIKPGAVRAAHAVRFFGSAACTRGSRVTLISGAFSNAHKFRGRNAIYARIGAGGKYSIVTRIPAGRNPGRYAVTGRCDGVAFGVTAHLRILPAPPVARFTA